jgi:hypothetical protein
MGWRLEQRSEPESNIRWHTCWKRSDQHAGEPVAAGTARQTQRKRVPLALALLGKVPIVVETVAA